MALSDGGTSAATAFPGTDGRQEFAIRTPDQRLRVFVSSTLQELAAERLAVRRAISNLRLAPVLFESGARPHPPRNLYRAYLEQSHIFIGIYWERYGWVAPSMEISGLEDEYRLSGERPKLIYVKTPAPAREPGLTSLLESIKADDNASYKPFSSPEELQELVENDLAILLTERFELASATGGIEGRGAELPQPPTPLVGRRTEVEQVRQLLLDDGVRLVTLYGPGGIGKTRLGLAVAQSLIEAFPDGVRFVPLAPIRDGSFVAGTIAQALGLSVGSGAPLESIKGFLKGKRTLLLLDNFEQVLDAAPLVAELLTSASGLKVLVTSRSVLRLSSEHEFAVPALSLPEPDGDPGRSEAVTLFTNRARAVVPDFEPGPEQAPYVVEICRRLDGLPLAIELAAARVKFLPPRTLLRKLDRRLDVLTGGPRDLPDRQQTIRSTLDWSYRLLGKDERAVFARLGLFVGGFSLEAAEAVTDDLEGVETIEVLFSLADKSLLRHQLSDDEPRFYLLETVREYAQERWRSAPEAPRLRRKHADYYLKLSERAASELRGQQQPQWLDQLSREHPNLRAALRRSLADGEYGLVVRMAWNLWPYWWIRGHQNEGRRWVEGALERGRDLSAGELAKANFVAGAMAVIQGEYEAARERARASVDLARQVGDRHIEATGLLGQGLVALYSQEFEAAAGMFETAYELYRELDDWWGQAHVLHYQWRLAAFAGRAGEEIEKLERSAELFRNHGDRSALVLILHNLALAALAAGDTGRAASLLEEGVRYSQELRNKWYLACCLEGFACLAIGSGELDEGARLLGAAQALRELVHAPLSPAEETLYARHLRLLGSRLDEATTAALREEGKGLGTDAVLRLLDSLRDRALARAADEGGAFAQGGA